MITCIYVHVSDGVKWHRPRAHGGAWWCTVVYAALAGWAAGRLGVWWCMDCVCSVCSGVQGQTGVACDIGGGGVPKYCSVKRTHMTRVVAPLVTQNVTKKHCGNLCIIEVLYSILIWVFTI